MSLEDDNGVNLAQSDEQYPPVKIITKEDMEAYYRGEIVQEIPEGVEVMITHAFDVSVVGYPGDKIPLHEGVREIADVVKILESYGIPSCIVGEAALQYYGSERVLHQWVICVPSEKLDQAAYEMRKNDKVVPFEPSALKGVFSVDHLFPRFKFVGISCFFVILSSQATHITCAPENVEYGQYGVPYPKLHVFAQSLLETNNEVDLAELVDGMNLSLDWGEANLNLEGPRDPEWERWICRMHNLPKAPDWCDKPELAVTKREMFEEVASTKAKILRQGVKYRDGYETKYWKKGSIDPRLRNRDFC